MCFFFPGKIFTIFTEETFRVIIFFEDNLYSQGKMLREMFNNRAKTPPCSHHRFPMCISTIHSFFCVNIIRYTKSSLQKI